MQCASSSHGIWANVVGGVAGASSINGKGKGKVNGKGNDEFGPNAKGNGQATDNDNSVQAPKCKARHLEQSRALPQGHQGCHQQWVASCEGQYICQGGCT